jgi:hypothetical protein
MYQGLYDHVNSNDTIENCFEPGRVVLLPSSFSVIKVYLINELYKHLIFLFREVQDTCSKDIKMRWLLLESLELQISL